MACVANGMSDEEIGEALIREVIVEELKDIPSQDVPPLTPLPVELGKENKQRTKVVNQLGKMVRIVGDKVKGDVEFQDAIDGLVKESGSKRGLFQDLANQVMQDGISWEKIAVLFYVAGKMAAKMVLAHLPQPVKDVLMWTVEFFKTHLLGWIEAHGGWISSFSELAEASMQKVSMGSNRASLFLIFITGLVLGSFTTWRLTR